jgi:hypothetical protein
MQEEQSSQDKVLPTSTATPTINLNHLEALLNHVLGKVLTVVDATVMDKEQRDAQKSLYKSAVWDTFSVIEQWHFQQNMESGTGSTFPFGNDPLEPKMNF